MKKLEDVNEENELINMIRKAVMPVTVKEAVLKHHEIGQDLFNNFVKEWSVECRFSVWSPMKKTSLHT